MSLHTEAPKQLEVSFGGHKGEVNILSSYVIKGYKGMVIKSCNIGKYAFKLLHRSPERSKPPSCSIVTRAYPTYLTFSNDGGF